MSLESPNRLDDAPPPPGANVLHDIGLIFVDPVRVFFNLPRINRSTAALVILLVVQGVIGAMIVSTGVYAYEVRRQAARAAMAHLKAHEGDDDPNVAIEQAEGIEKAAEFQVIFYRVARTYGLPLLMLVSVGLFAGILFVAVALSGGKPKMALLMGIVAFASLVQIPHDAVKLYLTSETRHSRVEVSAAAFPQSVGDGQQALLWYVLLRRLNPFDVWFWWLVHLGARKAARMTGRGATVAVLAMMVLDVLCQSGIDYAELMAAPPAGPGK